MILGPKPKLFNDSDIDSKIFRTFTRFLKNEIMNKEQEDVDVLEEELVENEKSLILVNDDVNTFEHVIKSLMEVCQHTHEQAETCAWITHYKGKCAVRHGSFDELKPYYDALLERHLTVRIE